LSNETPSQSPPSGDGPVLDSRTYEPAPGLAGDPFLYVSKPRVRFQHIWWKHILLLVLTLITTTFVGGLRYYLFLTDFSRTTVTLDDWGFVTRGFWYSGTIIAILGAHEMGHYFACRRYQVDATLPYFIPLLLPVGGIQIGTLGAVIRIREMFPSRKALFDIGVAGPIAGFLVLVPALFLGMYMSSVTVSPPQENLITIGKPLLFRAVRWLVFGPLPEGSIVNLHPMVWAAWFGMLATALNLLPFGQLDGGHISYAALGRLSTPISLVTVFAATVMTFFSLSWLLMTLLMLGMLALFGPRHPPVLNEYEPIGTTRHIIAFAAVVMLILCFTPMPIQFP
jgi:membrane-associated protease RseP (regulator of RpoE activity)